MKRVLKQVVVGTSLESFARKVYGAVSGRGSTRQQVSELNNEYDFQTVAVMQRVLRHDSNCIDVGCHEGSILRHILRFAPDGTHWVFEPLPEFYHQLVASFGGMPTVHVSDLALGDSTGSTTFQHVVSNPAYSGFRPRKYDRADEHVQEITVKADLLDNVIPADTAIDFIKIDVEGAELQVLKGAAKTIQRSRPTIVFEHGLGAADCYGTTPERVYEILEKCGLRLFLMARWLERPGDPSMNKTVFCEEFSTGSNYYFMAAP